MFSRSVPEKANHSHCAWTTSLCVVCVTGLKWHISILNAVVCVLAFRGRYKKRWKYRDKMLMLYESGKRLSAVVHTKAPQSCSNTAAAVGRHRHGFPISSLTSRHVQLGTDTDCGAKLNALHGSFLARFETQRQTSGHWSLRFSSQDASWRAVCCLMLTYWNRALFLIVHDMRVLRDFLHCSAVTLSFQTLKSKAAFYK